MKNVYPVNGLPFWNEAEIMEREHFVRVFAMNIDQFLRAENAAWHMHRIEAPALTPAGLINQNYTDKDVFFTSGNSFPITRELSHQGEIGDVAREDAGTHSRSVGSYRVSGPLVMRPETTPGSYAYAKMLLDAQQDRPPFVVWQAGRSYRQEQEQVTKNMRLKEFYQQEFQCLFTEDTKNDYMAVILPKLADMIGLALGRKSRVVESDRLPSYSQKTMDIEVELPHKWMEIASVSLRTDFTTPFTYTTGKGSFEKKILVLEVAIGLDRCIYAKFLPANEDDGL